MFTMLLGIAGAACGAGEEVEAPRLHPRGAPVDAPSEAPVGPTSTPVPSTGQVRSVSAGETRSCAVLSDGSVRCWGHTKVGWRAYAIDGVSGAVAVAVGDTHVCARLEQGAVTCWGSGYDGQLGTGRHGTAWSDEPPTLVPGLSDVTAISARYKTTYARRADGSVFVWGKYENWAAASCDPWVEECPPSEPVITRSPEVFVALQTAATVASFEYGACAITAGGVTCAEPYHGATTFHALPNARRVEGECALDVGGTVQCWGDFAAMDLTSLTNASELSVHRDHGCAVANGRVACWGANRHGELGDGSTADRTTPVLVQGLEDAVSVAAGIGFTCALRANGTVWCWGANASGQLGDGTLRDRLTPGQVLGL